jgi:hypothetical protein
MATATEKTPPKAPRAATPWGPAELVQEVSVSQRVGERRFAVVVQLLEAPGRERLIRFAYTTDGSARRGPVTMRARDLERLRAALERAPVLSDALSALSSDP